MREVPIPAHISILFVEQEVRCMQSLLLPFTNLFFANRSWATTPLPLIPCSKPTYGATTS